MTTPIRGRDSLTVTEAQLAVRAVTPRDVRPAATAHYVARMREQCLARGLTLRVMLGQFLHETGFCGPLGRWNELNPAGLGITTGNDNTPYTIDTGEQAADVHVWSMLVALREWEEAEKIDLPPVFNAWKARWTAKYRHPACPVVNDVEDLNLIYRVDGDVHATWAIDPDYDAKLSRVMRTTFSTGHVTPVPPKEPPMALTFGNVKHPAYVDLIVNNRYWNDLGPRRAVGVSQHSMVGTLYGSYVYIRDGSGQALWDYSVGGATDGENDGVIWRHNDPRGRRAGWANGGSDGLEGDGPLFVRTLGIDAINRDLVSIERSDGGRYSTQPMSAKQFESICQLTAYWFDQAEVPWDQYPYNPNVGCVTHMLHKEFATKDCPFPPVYNEINRLQNRVRAILKAAQTAVDVPDEVEPEQPIEQDHDRYPNGWTAKELQKQWGVLPRMNPGGSVTRLHFAVTKNPIAAIANTWVQRGAADGIKDVTKLPKPQVWQVIQVDEDTKSDLITFEGDRDAWMLWRPNIYVPWTWTDARALADKAA